ncbi:MAG: apolipoprotein N-acyltransferase [Planctomycetes bacterium]|nr:apolipoprotein N-acyltransferase [Planctomycetota bacterium]
MPTTPAATKSVKPLYLTAMASGLLLYASFFPLNLGFIAWFALVPFLFLIQSEARPRHVYLAAYVGGLAFYIPAIQWMRVAHVAMYATWLILALYCSLYFCLGIWLLRKLKRIPTIIAVPAVLVGLDYFRAHFPTGFPWLDALGIRHHTGFSWYMLGYSQHDWLPLIQIADFTGVYGVSFLVITVNTAIFLWVSRYLKKETTSRPWFATTLAAASLIATLAYGYHRLDHPPFEEGPRLAMLQSDLPQAVKMEQGVFVRRHMVNLLYKAMLMEPKPDLVIWPETTFENDWYDIAPGTEWNETPLPWRTRIGEGEQFARSLAGWGCSQLLGLNGLVWDKSGTTWKYNSALLMGKNGMAGPRYDKMHLVPFGEYVPLRNVFPWMKAFTPYTNDYSCKPGEHFTRFPLEAKNRTFQFGVVICYEDTDPTLARNYVLASNEGPPVDFLVNITTASRSIPAGATGCRSCAGRF